MKDIVINDYGTSLHLENSLLVVKNRGERIIEYPLSKIKSITIAKQGVSLSSNIILECSNRNIKIYFLDFKGVQIAGVSRLNAHGVSNVRKSQFYFIDSKNNPEIAKEFIAGKIHNQRAVLKYIGKYLSKKDTCNTDLLENACSLLMERYKSLKNARLDGKSNWRNIILGQEGEAASIYWDTLIKTNIVPGDFKYREGRNAKTISNQVLNFGYAILASKVWSCLINAGLEIYAGCLHTPRPGKPSLVLDVMEEYRPWVVDRILIKHRNIFSTRKELDTKCKEIIIQEVHKTFSRRYPYRGKKIKLEHLLQRQCYRLSAHFQNQRKYKAYLFRW